jgi:hypothetical protein
MSWPNTCPVASCSAPFLVSPCHLPAEPADLIRAGKVAGPHSGYQGKEIHRIDIVGPGGIGRVRQPPQVGTTSRNSSRRLPARSGFCGERPVTLPPGRVKLATRPGAASGVNEATTIGMVDVASRAATAGAVVEVTKIKKGCLTRPVARNPSAA